MIIRNEFDNGHLSRAIFCYAAHQDRIAASIPAGCTINTCSEPLCIASESGDALRNKMGIIFKTIERIELFQVNTMTAYIPFAVRRKGVIATRAGEYTVVADPTYCGLTVYII